MFDNKTKRPILVDDEGKIIPVPAVVGEWQSATIIKGGTSTGAVDLGDNYKYLQIVIPTLDTATVKLTVSETPAGTFYDLDAVTTTSGTHNYATTFNLGGYRYLKVVASAAQTTAAIAIRVRGLGGM